MDRKRDLPSLYELQSGWGPFLPAPSSNRHVWNLGHRMFRYNTLKVNMYCVSSSNAEIMWTFNDRFFVRGPVKSDGSSLVSSQGLPDGHDDGKKICDNQTYAFFLVML